ncbi:AraC family transcriptional regulator [Aureimonas frigidaquae]|uniref:DNA-binding domain-containing protein, AraC-type n=1 Tax=Aureimonas frigidaquae TaxID=424757 RepID=A0A0P0Z1K6_9HYPH|nr:AraC family transcriptional regulator [Aureimonas frigidaquae]BAT27926.1 DNA-binding domain-containing protein, AraC-type [Aureimonas frigidaquae]
MLDQSSNPDTSTIDPLSDMLRGLRLEGVTYKRCQMDTRFGRSFADGGMARLHVVSGADCWLREPGGAWVEIPDGTGVFLPRGEAHALASSPDEALLPFEAAAGTRLCDGVFDLDCGACKGGPIIFTGLLRFNIDASHPLLRLMPDVMRSCALAHGGDGRDAAVPSLIEAMAQELSLERVGAAGILARLADVLAALIIRSFVENGCADATGWIAAVRNPDIGRVLAAIHRNPEAEWSLARMAGLMGASRSGFAERFARIVGETPARYVARVRMYEARQWLQRDGIRVAAAADRLGYESEASFSRAFKRIVGVSPGRLRAAASDGAASAR